jgi:hypothetical protein
MVRREFLFVVTGISVFFFAAYFEWQPIRSVMNWKAATSARAANQVNVTNYEVIDRSVGEDPFITVDFLKGKHFWHPQVAIWMEDSLGNYLETLVVTTSTAQGLFYSGRSADNFREFDDAKNDEGKPTRRVDALPVWSHKRNIKHTDGFYSPSPDHRMPDAVTMATPSGNFYLKSPRTLLDGDAFKIMVEINVAFDENEYYSEYDFVEDALYHGGTGLLGQPSIIYGAVIKRTDTENYYLLKEIGRGHHSGSTGAIFTDLNTLTTARHVVERLVVSVNESWYTR